VKITAIHATPVRVPRRGTFVSSLGADSYTLNAVVEVETDTGITGLGEASSIWGERGIGEARAIEEGLAPAVIGADPLAINALVAKMDAAVAESWPAKAGIEIALHDIAGKALGVPVHALLGGAVRERILLSHSLSMGSAAEIAEEAARLVGLGYRTLKVKVGRDADADEARA
jgi:L-alanine-DL-glutamate epimerase-like enolase superfamily enzyme